MSAPTISSFGLGSTIAGGVMGAFGANAQGQSQGAMYDYQAGVAQINAQIAMQNADYARNKGEMDALKFGVKAGQQKANIVAAQASSGLDINSGSAKDVQKSQDTLSHMDLDTIRGNAAKTAYDYTTLATGFENQATLDRMAGENSRSAGRMNAFSSILGSVGSVSSRWLQGNQMGLFGGGSRSGGGDFIDLHGWAS